MDDLEKINDAINALHQIFAQIGSLVVDINGLIAIEEILNELKKQKKIDVGFKN